MRVRILRRSAANVNGISLRHYHLDQVYDLPPTLASYLVVERLAMFEMRNAESPQPPNYVERRRHH